MSCNSGSCECGGKCGGKCGGGGGGCKDTRARGKRRMTEWRQCEPFCSNGCHTACGAVYMPDGKRCDAVCQKWGPHANQQRRDADISPSDGAAIESAFQYEVYTTTLLYELPGFAGWYFVPLGALGLSHQFCLREASATIADELGAPAPLPITNVRLAGARIACDSESQGSYVWVIDRSVGADPDAIEITDGRCACRDLCAWTPSRGLEFFLFEFAQPVGAGAVTTTLKIERCDWLVEVDPCVGPVNNRVRFADVAVPSPISPIRRVQPGNIPFVP